MPVYNAPECVRDCLRSVARHTQAPYRLVVVDDSGGDPEIRELLAAELAESGAELIVNPRNLGYTRSINLAIAHTQGEDVVLLNSDVEVGPRWLSNLRNAAYHRPRIGTVTPLSNNAGAFSAPVMDGNNPLPDGVAFDRVARAVHQTAHRCYPRVPTGNGFCLYITRRCLEQTGTFDESRFPIGYGEENDFCMRAGALGWQHVIDDATYVRHVRSVSFGDRKAALVKAAKAQLDALHPGYGKKVARMKRSRVLKGVRRRVARAFVQLAEKQPGVRPRIVFVLCVWRGGTPQTNRDLMEAISDRYDCYVLYSDGRRMTLYAYDRGDYKVVHSHRFLTRLRPLPHSGRAQDWLVRRWLVDHSIECVHIRHIGLQTVHLPRIAHQLGIPVVMSLHDFYTLCPTVRLVDELGQFCGGECTDSAGPCRPSLWQPYSFPRLKHEGVLEWRKLMASMLEDCDRFVTTSETARTLITRHFPALAGRQFAVIPHGRDFAYRRKLGRAPAAGEPIRILVPGNISKTKGADLIREMAELDRERKLEFHILGRAAACLRQVEGVVLHGEYLRQDFLQHIVRIRPHAGVVLSIWPETFCHTLTEMWMCGLPVFAYDLGAVGERIRQQGGGWLIALADAATTLQWILSVCADRASFEARLSELGAIQDDAIKHHTTAHMAERYVAIYRELGVRSSPELTSGAG